MTASWAWLALAVVIVAFVVIFDVWANLTGHTTMSGQVHHWLTESWTGAAVIAIWVGVPLGLIYNFFLSKYK